MPRQEKFSKKSDLAFSSQNRTEKGVVSAEKDAPERIGFRDGADLRLGAIEGDQHKRRERERKRERERRQSEKSQNSSKYIKEYIERKERMHGNA